MLASIGFSGVGPIILIISDNLGGEEYGPTGIFQFSL